MTAPDFIWARASDGDAWQRPIAQMTPFPSLQPYVRRDPAVLAELPEVQALIAAAVEGAANLCGKPNGPWLASAYDCRAAILASIPADAKAALGRMLREERNEALRQAASVACNACLVDPDGGSPTEDERLVCEEAYRRILALIQEAPHDPA